MTLQAVSWQMLGDGVPEGNSFPGLWLVCIEQKAIMACGASLGYDEMLVGQTSCPPNRHSAAGGSQSATGVSSLSLLDNPFFLTNASTKG